MMAGCDVSGIGRENLEEGQTLVMANTCRDLWRWALDEDGVFVVKTLSRLIDKKNLKIDRGANEMRWCKLVPKKENVFVWRALKKILPVRVELDKRGIDLHTILCPCCNNGMESLDHCLATCNVAVSVWDKLCKWWKVDVKS